MKKVFLFLIFFVVSVSFVYAQDYSVIAVIDGPEIGEVNEELTFSASNSEFGNGSRLEGCFWDFGDGTTVEGTTIEECDVTYSFAETGEYEIKLSVTGSYGETNETSYILIITSLEEEVKSLLDKTAVIVDNLNSQIGNLSIDSEVVEFLDLIADLENISDDLTGAQVQYNNLITFFSTGRISEAKKEEELEEIKERVLELQTEIPLSLSTESLIFSSELDFPNEIPDEIVKPGLSGQGRENYKKSVFSFQQESMFKADAVAYLVNIEYMDNSEESFVYVKKDISVSTMESGFIVEYIPKEVVHSISAENILTEGYSVVSADPILKWQLRPSMSIEYRLDIDGLESVYKTRTFVIPAEVEKMDFSYGDVVCGDGICVVGIEDEIWCPEDCKIKKPWVLTILLIIIVIIGIFYINFYKGKYNFREVANILSVKFAGKRLFTSKEDMENLVRYIRNAIRKGISDVNIRYILIRKGWKKEQIDYGFRKARKR
jgi:PKD repeat protein